MPSQEFEKWLNKPLTPQFLIDSGLLYEINRTVLHLMGIRLAVNEKGEFSLVDDRESPTITFTDKVNESASKKLNKFMKEFGLEQLNTRREKLGFGTQAKQV